MLSETYHVDDILIFSRTKDDHNRDVKQVLDRLVTIRLRINSKKCQFCKDEVDFLGYTTVSYTHLTLPTIYSV